MSGRDVSDCRQATRSGLRVLVVDDDPSTVELLVEYLTIGGHSAEGVRGGRQAIERIRGGAYDLVVTDLTMPEVDGVRVAEGVRGTAPGTPVILVSAREPTPDQAGHFDLALLKPLRLHEMLDAVACAMGKATGAGA